MARKVPSNLNMDPDLKSSIQAYAEVKGESYSKCVDGLLRDAVSQVYLGNLSLIDRISKVAKEDPHVLKMIRQKEEENDALEGIAQEWMDKQSRGGE